MNTDKWIFGCSAALFIAAVIFLTFYRGHGSDKPVIVRSVVLQTSSKPDTLLMLFSDGTVRWQNANR